MHHCARERKLGMEPIPPLDNVEWVHRTDYGTATGADIIERYSLLFLGDDRKSSLGLMSTVFHRGKKDGEEGIATVVEICSSKMWNNMQPLPIASAHQITTSKVPTK